MNLNWSVDVTSFKLRFRFRRRRFLLLHLHIVAKASSAMADNKFRVIWCIVQDDTAVFKVTASVDDDVADLKKLVYEQGINTTINTFLAKNLTLWKVSVL